MSKFAMMYLMGFVLLLGNGVFNEPGSVQSAIFVLLANVWFVGAHICDAIESRPKTATAPPAAIRAGGTDGH